jgi:hypothetical protein
VNVADGTAEYDPTLVERWLKEQQLWQRTLSSYLDSMMKNDDFLVHLGNAMRGSLLAGKPYPTAAVPGANAHESASDDRLDQVLFALRQLQGQVQDLQMTIDEIRQDRRGHTPASSPSVSSNRSTKNATSAIRPSKSRKRRTRG